MKRIVLVLAVVAFIPAIFASCARAEVGVDVSIVLEEVRALREENERLREIIETPQQQAPEPQPAQPVAPEPTPNPTPTPEPTPPPFVALRDMEPFTWNVPFRTILGAEMNAWMSNIGAGRVRTWDSTRQDNAGNSHLHGGILSLGDVNESSVTYLLNGEFSRFEGVIALSWNSRAITGELQIRSWGDDNVLFTSPSFTGGTLPSSFDINVSGIQQLRIERISPNREGGEIGVVNAQLHR